ncbi:hypothetical protein Goshw_027200 [Gossypium schwendimanii]|uniref:RNase H type-1 domain-containing protein n=1 Tax=Gossypium schwendimanii TaxID=34291 RepID=A0A7J9MKA0_GOSSC|nr:hypothetical protein [Gossypium schwendimanii]
MGLVRLNGMIFALDRYWIRKKNIEQVEIIGIVIEDEAECGGVLRDDKGVPYAMFSGLIEATGSGMAEVRVIKTVVEMFISMGWHEKVPL